MPIVVRCLAACLAAALIISCAGPRGTTSAERRQAALDMRADTIAELYRLVPGAEREIANAEGYGVFSNIGVNVILASLGNGYGVVEDHSTGERVYMKMVSGGLGFGLGVKDFRGIFVFTDRGAMKFFVERGWDASAQMDIAAKAGDKGAAFAGAIDVAPGIKLYQITRNGLALQATIQGTKYWRDNDLTSPTVTFTGS